MSVSQYLKQNVYWTYCPTLNVHLAVYTDWRSFSCFLNIFLYIDDKRCGRSQKTDSKLTCSVFQNFYLDSVISDNRSCRSTHTSTFRKQIASAKPSKHFFSSNSPSIISVSKWYCCGLLQYYWNIAYSVTTRPRCSSLWNAKECFLLKLVVQQ